MTQAQTRTTQNQGVVTAVGRLLKPRNGEPQIHKVIAVYDDNTVETVINEVITQDDA